MFFLNGCWAFDCHVSTPRLWPPLQVVVLCCRGDNQLASRRRRGSWKTVSYCGALASQFAELRVSEMYAGTSGDGWGDCCINLCLLMSSRRTFPLLEPVSSVLHPPLLSLSGVSCPRRVWTYSGQCGLCCPSRKTASWVWATVTRPAPCFETAST